MTTPLSIEPVEHQNIAVPPGYEKLMPLRQMPTVGGRKSE